MTVEERDSGAVEVIGLRRPRLRCTARGWNCRGVVSGVVQYAGYTLQKINSAAGEMPIAK